MDFDFTDFTPVRVSLTDFESDFVDAIASAEGKSRSEVLRELIVGEARRELGLYDDEFLGAGTVNASH